MNWNPPLALAAGLAIAAAAAGCSSPSLSWVFEFGDPALADRAVTVEGRILRGGCDGTEIWSARATRTESPDTPPELEPGVYGLEGVAIDGDCVAFATGCVEVTIPTSDESTTVVLEASAESPECPASQCVDGVCGAPADASLDAPADTIVADTTVTDSTVEDTTVADTMPLDAGACMNDGDCPSGTCVDGACCNGCVIFGACAPGTDPGACGVGGGACATCTCPTEACSAGACVPGHPIGSLATSNDATCVETLGDLFCWGVNDVGQLALGSAGVRETTPMMSPTPLAFDTLGDGQNSLFGIVSGALYGWGDNGEGQLGLGDTANRATPVRVGAASNWTFVESGVDGDSTCGIRRDDSLYCWGQNDRGQIGNGTTSAAQLTPIEVGGAWSAVAIGHYHVCAVRADGTLWCWGGNELGQLGLGDAGMMTNRTMPTRVGSASDWVEIDAGEYHTCGLRGTGTLWCWGQNDDAQLGLGHTMPTIFSPTRVGSASDWRELECGEDHSCALRGGGDLFCWGINSSGQSGTGSSGGDVSMPSRVGAATGWSGLSVGSDHSCVLDPRAVLHCWGRNSEGELGLGDVVQRPSPTPICW